ncbi:hypothetical protein L218DRAFT_964491 [Marasmius fiardii PR-910]|nr:hypothetical protein L218DRAFT_964491 [Marasmius fiardii PR-910]
MDISICGHSAGYFDFANECVRTSWTALVPATLVLVLCLSSFFLTKLKLKAPQVWWWPFKRFLTIQEAEALALQSTTDSNPNGSESQGSPGTTALAKGDGDEDTRITAFSVVIVFIGLLEIGCWTAIGVYTLSFFPKSHYEVIISKIEALWTGIRPLFLAATWVYTVFRRIYRPTRAAPLDLFAVYVALSVSGVLEFGGLLYGSSIPTDHLRAPTTLEVVGYTLNLVGIMVCLGCVLRMPLSVPIAGVKKEEIGKSISPEDYITLWGWISFSWIYPIVALGNSTTLEESDVWNLSPMLHSRVLFQKFVALTGMGAAVDDTKGADTLVQSKKGLSFFKRVLKANAMDIMLDSTLAFTKSCLTYLNPFFLNRILSSIDKPANSVTQADRSNAYIYACLMFLTYLLKAQSDLNRLYFGRRAATRARAEMMAAIYEKALKKKEVYQPSGRHGTGFNDEETEGDAEDAADEDEKIAEQAQVGRADVGKIVNLMSGDVVIVLDAISELSKIWSTPMELMIGCTYLYSLLGWSAFSGFLVFLVISPASSLLSRRTIKIKKGMSSATDTRMRLLNELLRAVKFVKFFAWEKPWIKKVMVARKREIRWLVKARINATLYFLLWMSAPILVSIVAFTTYVLQGNELTVSTAFTAVALFGMIRTPLNVLPNVVVQILNTQVALERITTFLKEPEVDERVSMLKAEALATARVSGDRGTSEEEQEAGLGFINATITWNEDEDVFDHHILQNLGRATDREDAVPGHLPRNGSWFSLRSSASSKFRTLTSKSPATTAMYLSVPTHARSGHSSPSSSGFNTPDSQDNRYKFELRDISVIFPDGKLTVVTGPTASGKTSLLLAVLGEMTLLSGKLVLNKNHHRLVQLPGAEGTYLETISYASQAPWLRNQTIKENILFGYPYDPKRYREVVKACALVPDFNVLEDGDQTEIGAGGVSLSGGQKARVALARAIYARTKYVLLDDPLSAVDSHTARYLFEKLLCGPLLRGRTVVLVTHHVDLVLPGAHYFVHMLDGRIDIQGTVEELRDRGLLEGIAPGAVFEAHRDALAVAATEEETGKDTADIFEETKKPARKLIETEARAAGRVKWKIYKKYLEASSYYTWVILILFVVLNQLLGVGEKLWMMQWGQAYRDDESDALVLSTATSTLTSALRAFPMGSPSSRTFEYEHAADSFMYWQHHLHTHTSNLSCSANAGATYLANDGGASGGTLFGIHLPSAREHPLFYVGVYAVIGLSTVLVNIYSVIAQYAGALRASRVLFKQLLEKVLRATFRFHDTTPQGRILNRFGKDIEKIDSSLAGSLSSVNTSLASFFASIVTIGFVFPLFLVPATIFGFIYRKLAKAYLNTGRDLRRMEANSRSPIFSCFGELLEGIVTVRAFSAERQFLDGLHEKIDHTSKFYYAFWMTNRWLLLNFDCIGGLLVFITALFSISRTDDAAAGIAGLCISSAISFTTSVYWGCRFWTGLELDLNSVERVIEYLEIPQEPPAIIESNRPPAYWPSSHPNNDSLIRVENLRVKYAPDLPDVLHDVSFTLRAGERVGLIGRTGSGKSTLAMSVLRFVDPLSGRVVIDGIDISTIGTYDLRSRLTFIPQDATLFSGTLRENLDPFNERTDEECLDVLYRVQVMHPTPAATPTTSRTPSRAPSPESVSASSTTEVESRSGHTINLYTEVSGGGSNFSQGQRQLISLARALLRRSPVIVLDEATSSLDFATDEKIQKAIREEFGDSLLLTVAHRLRTVIDYDRLIVLDKGRLMEFDTPLNLIRKKDGIFRDMCMKSGTFAELEAAAAAVKKDSLRGRR